MLGGSRGDKDKDLRARQSRENGAGELEVGLGWMAVGLGADDRFTRQRFDVMSSVTRFNDKTKRIVDSIMTGRGRVHLAFVIMLRDQETAQLAGCKGFLAKSCPQRQASMDFGVGQQVGPT